MQRFKTGRRPAVHDLKSMRGALALFPHLQSLGVPPASSDDYVAAVNRATAALTTPPGGGGGPWGIFLNNQLGDCVCADSCHQVMLHTANAGAMVVPTDDECLALYEAVGGYVPGNAATDQGCDETSMCRYLETAGIAGQKSSGTAMVDPTNLDHIRWTVQLFGACRLGIIVDQQMEDQFSAGEPWTTAAASNDSTAGGHDVPVVQYDSQYAYVVTWGKLQPVTWELMASAAFLDESHAEVWSDFVTSGGTAPNGLDLQQLLSDLAAINA
jgi:hypothetical protein